MTTAEKNQLKLQALDGCIASLRHIVRHNGAALSARATIGEVAAHVMDCNPDRVKTLWTDINTIDKVKQILDDAGRLRMLVNGVIPEEPSTLTPEELLEYAVNDERLTAGHHSWAVLRITKKGTEILTCGGNLYQAYRKNTITEESTDDASGEVTTTERIEIVQDGDTDVLAVLLNKEDTAWMSETFEADIHGNPTYTENGVEYIHIPCTLPGDLSKLISMHITRTDLEDGSEVEPLEYALTTRSCDTSNPGMVMLPHGIWLCYDNDEYASVPLGLLIPKDMADGTITYLHGLTGKVDKAKGRFEKIRICYSSLASGMERLRLVGDSFGDEYIIGGIDFTYNFELGGTWKE